MTIVNYKRLGENEDIQKKIRKTEYREQDEHTKDKLKQYKTMGSVATPTCKTTNKNNR